MERDFWLERWQLGQIGFHQADINARLQRFWPALNVRNGAAVFVPMCGKSRDMIWLAQLGHRVIGVELSQIAVDAFFTETATPHVRRRGGRFVIYEAENVRILCGDFFDLRGEDLVGVEALFDRGALVALPPSMRSRYAEHLLNVLPVGAQSLLLTMEYDQSLAEGPPFSVTAGEVDALFGLRCRVVPLDASPTSEMPPRFQARGIRVASEATYRVIKLR